MRRLLIAGSRKCWTSPISIDNALKTLTGDTDDEQFTVVTGGANGADISGEQWADERGHVNEVHNADWDQYGKRAGYIRNAEMVDSGINFALIFWDGQSKGTANTMKLLRDAHIDHVISVTYYE